MASGGPPSDWRLPKPMKSHSPIRKGLQRNRHASDEVEEYPHDAPMRGHAVFVVNEKSLCGSKFRERQGAREDLDKIERVFIGQLGFKWLNPRRHEHYDMTLANWDDLLAKMRKADHSQCDCFVFVISTHGQERVNPKTRTKELLLKLSDGNGVFISEILALFKPTANPALANKPKIFIVQACRVDPSDNETPKDDEGATIWVREGLVTDTTGAPRLVETDDGLEGFTEGSRVEEEAPPRLEMFPDLLVVYSAPPGKRAKRTPGGTEEEEEEGTDDAGSWMIDGLAKAMRKYDFEHPQPFLRVLTKMNSIVAIYKESTTHKKNIPCICHTLTKTLVFREKTQDTPELDAPDLNFDFPCPNLSGEKKKKKKKGKTLNLETDL